MKGNYILHTVYQIEDVVFLYLVYKETEDRFKKLAVQFRSKSKAKSCNGSLEKKQKNVRYMCKHADLNPIVQIKVAGFNSPSAAQK